MKQQYIIIGYEAQNSSIKRRLADSKASYLETVRELKANGSFIEGGAIQDHDGKMIGSVMIVAFDSKDELDQWVGQNQYLLHNVWEEVQIRPFTCADNLLNKGAFFGAAPVTTGYRKFYAKPVIMGIGILLCGVALSIGIPKVFNNSSKEKSMATFSKVSSVNVANTASSKVVPVIKSNKKKSVSSTKEKAVAPTLTAEHLSELEVPKKAVLTPGKIPVSSDSVVIDYDIKKTPEVLAAMDNRAYVSVEQMPSFNGNLSKYIKNNLFYPESAIERKVQGTVFLSFIVGANGVIRDIKVLKGLSEELDREAIRVVQRMKPWIPGKQSGKPVPVQYSLPIVFKLD